MKGSDGSIQPLDAVYHANPEHEDCGSAAACFARGAATSILIDPSMRATQRTRDISEDFYTIYKNLTATPVHGRPPKHVMVTANTFPRGWPRSLESKGINVVDEKWNTAVMDFEQMHGLTANRGQAFPRNCTTPEQQRVNCTDSVVVGMYLPS